MRLQLVKVLGLNPSRPISLKQGFFDMGMDSLTSMELRNRLQTSLALPLSSTLTFKYPTLETLIDYVASQLMPVEDRVEPDIGARASEDGDEISEEELNALLDRKLALVEQLSGDNES